MTAPKQHGQADILDEAAPGVFLYLPFTRLPEDSEEMLNRLALASGLHAGDMRYKIVGRGVNRMTPSLPLQKQKDLVAEMQDMGIPAVIVGEKNLRRRLGLRVVQRVEITGSEMHFYDRNEEPVFRIGKDTRLLIIAADLAQKKRKQAFVNPDVDAHLSRPSFEDGLKKISVGSPAAVFCRIGSDPPECILLEHSSFRYRSMDEHMQMSAAANFRTLITKASKYSKDCIADHGFSTTTLARIVYDESSSKREMLANLGRYTNYMLAAAESGLVLPDGETDADFYFKSPLAAFLPGKNRGIGPPPGGIMPDHDSTGEQNDEEDENGPSRRPKPPPPLEHSGVIARLFSTPHEIIYALIFLLAPFVSVFVQAGDHAHPLFWETATGIFLAGAGLLVFSYGLLMLNYKRMVENTPTSRIRSMAMGIVEVTGQARQYYNLRTSHSGTRCIYFRCRYFRKRATPMHGRTSIFQPAMKNTESWVLERETTSGRLPFYIEDETGRALVRPEKALFLISRFRQEFSGTFGMFMSNDLRRSDRRVHEDIIPEGARVYVLGKARPEKTGSSIAEKINAELRALKTDNERLMAYDADGNGRVDLEEWETARRDTENRVYAEMLAKGGQMEQVVIGKPGFGMLPLIIADTEEVIIRKLGLRVWLFLAGGMLLIITGVQMLMQRYVF